MNDFESLNQRELECDDFFGMGVFADPKEPKKPIAEPQIKKEESKTEAPRVLLTRQEAIAVDTEVPSASSIERATPRIEVPRTEPTKPKQPSPDAAKPRTKTPFEQFLDTPGGHWVNGVVWSLLAFLLAEGLTHVFGARAYYSMIYKWFVFPILSAVGAGLFYMFNRETDSVIERNVVTAIEVTALAVTLQGLVRLLWI